MRIRKKPIDTVPFLLHGIDEIIKRATEQQANQTDTTDDHHPLVVDLRKIKRGLEEMKDSFPQFTHCEEDLVAHFRSLQQEFFEIPSQSEKIKHKLDFIAEKISAIRIFISNLTPVDESPQPGAPSGTQSRQDSEDWKKQSVEKQILASPAIADIQLIYDVLDFQLKLCFLCFAVFPFRAVIKKRPLIYWWIGEGLVTKTVDKNAEEFAESIFSELIGKGLIEPFHKSKKRPIIDGCTIHPWIQRMLISVATRAQCFDFDDDGKLSDNYSKSRRAILFRGSRGFVSDNQTKDNQNKDEELMTKMKNEELMTIFNVDEQYLSFAPESFFKFRKLAVLQLGRWQTSAKHHIEVEDYRFLEQLRVQKHLKYLNLQGVSRITAVPEAVRGCANLEILDVRACHNLERLPSDISSFDKLTHLDMSECYLLENMPKGVEKLSELQVLKGFVVGLSRKTCKLGDLNHLKKLRKLSIHIRREAKIDEEDLEKVKDFENLRILTISWGGVTLPAKQNDPKKNLNSGADTSTPQLSRTATLTMSSSFSLPPKLEKLDLRCFPRRLSPEWLIASNLEQLKRLYIRGGDLQSLYALSETKWEVEILRLKYLKNLKVNANEILEGFPNLRYFEKVRCHQFAESKYKMDVEWNVNEGLDALESRVES